MLLLFLCVDQVFFFLQKQIPLKYLEFRKDSKCGLIFTATISKGHLLQEAHYKDLQFRLKTSIKFLESNKDSSIRSTSLGYNVHGRPYEIISIFVWRAYQATQQVKKQHLFYLFTLSCLIAHSNTWMAIITMLSLAHTMEYDNIVGLFYYNRQ